MNNGLKFEKSSKSGMGAGVGVEGDKIGARPPLTLARPTFGIAD